MMAATMRRLFVVSLLFLSMALAAQTPQQTLAAAAQLQTNYNRETGLYFTTGWWNSANAITTLADLSLVLRTQRFVPVFENTLAQAPKKFPGFLNEYYDDEGWWALAWIRVYDLTHKEQYLATADAIFQDMTGGWDDTCDGGIWWSKKRTYKNAIANELFLAVAASLAKHSEGEKQASYRDWAEHEWKWFEGTGMINGDHLINDGLTAACKNNEKTTWTYNQGVILGGLASLSAVNHDASLLTTANTIARAAIIHLSDKNGVIHDPCEPECSEDGIQFKGIFVRNLASLPQTPEYAKFLRINAASVWTHARGPNNAFSTAWDGPYAHSNAGIQSSGLDALVANLSTTKRVK